MFIIVNPFSLRMLLHKTVRYRICQFQMFIIPGGAEVTFVVRAIGARLSLNCGY